SPASGRGYARRSGIRLSRDRAAGVGADGEAGDADAAGFFVPAVDGVVVDARFAGGAAAGGLLFDLGEDAAGLAQDGAHLGLAGEEGGAVEAVLAGVAIAPR